MSNRILVDAAVLRRTAQQFSHTKGKIDRTTKSMAQTIDSLNRAGWTGEAAHKYNQKFHQLDDDIQRVQKKVQEHIDDLMQIAKTYEHAEHTGHNMVASLPTDICG